MSVMRNIPISWQLHVSQSTQSPAMPDDIPVDKKAQSTRRGCTPRPSRHGVQICCILSTGLFGLRCSVVLSFACSVASLSCFPSHKAARVAQLALKACFKIISDLALVLSMMFLLLMSNTRHLWDSNPRGETPSA